MDIRQDNFWKALPTVLEAIANSEYAAVDLEMTGVQFKRGSRVAKPSLENMYEQAREGANAFCILQFGLTCFGYSEEKKTYLTKTFNFGLTPMFPTKEETDVRLANILDRTVSFSYSSLQFLRSHGFVLERAFEEGVPYLSRQETEVAEDCFLQNPDEVGVGYVDVSAQDAETQKFYSDARAQISLWVEKSCQPGSRPFLNISNPYGGRMNNLQVTLIRQLVRREFKDCRSFPRNKKGFMQIVKINEKDAKAWIQKLSARKKSVVKQTAFRYVLEALAGGAFADDLNTEWMINSEEVPGCNRAEESAKLKAKLKIYEAKLNQMRPILVGHNQFYDLCFIYRTFFGELPDNLDEFKAKLHKIFPRVVDTKILGSRGDHDMTADDNLGELFDSIESQDLPPVEEEVGYRHDRHSNAHQAGYDSWMTAVLFIKLSWKRFTDKKRPELNPSLSDDDDDAPPLRQNDYFAALDPFKSRKGQHSKVDGHQPSLPSSSLSSSPASVSVLEDSRGIKASVEQAETCHELPSGQTNGPHIPGLSPLAPEFSPLQNPVPTDKAHVPPPVMTETYAAKLAGPETRPIFVRPFTPAICHDFAPWLRPEILASGYFPALHIPSPPQTLSEVAAAEKRLSELVLLNGSAVPFVPPAGFSLSRRPSPSEKGNAVPSRLPQPRQSEAVSRPNVVNGQQSVAVVNDRGDGWDHEARTDRVPSWESKFWRVYGNKVRVGRSGALDLDV